MNKYPITHEVFSRLTISEWEIRELPKEHWDKIPGLPRTHDAISVFYSGSFTDPRALNGIIGIAGFDVVAYENKPKKDEPPINAYHCVIKQLDSSKNPCPYLLYGPFTEETLFGHRGGFDMLEKYANTLNSGIENNGLSQIPV